MAVLAKLYDISRKAERHIIEADATLRNTDQAPVDILVANISSTGCLFVCAEALDLDARITVGIPHLGRRQARVVRVLDQHYGCEFLSPISDGQVATVLTAGDTIVSFPYGLLATAAAPDDLPNVNKLPRWMRLMVLVGATLTLWLMIIRILVLLHCRVR